MTIGFVLFAIGGSMVIIGGKLLFDAIDPAVAYDPHATLNANDLAACTIPAAPLDEDHIFIKADDRLHGEPTSPNQPMTVTHKKADGYVRIGVEVSPAGELYMDHEGVLHFKGDMDASARIFFDSWLKPACDNYIQEELKRGKQEKTENSPAEPGGD